MAGPGEIMKVRRALFWLRRDPRSAAASEPMGLGLRDLRVWQEAVALGADVIRSMRQTNRREIKAITEHTMITALADRRL